MNNAVLLFLNIGTPELILIMFVALMLFGGDKLPGLARGLGKGIRDFKDASEGVKREINNQIYNYEEKKSEPAQISESVEDEEPKQLEEHTEDKPLLDYTPIEGTMPLGDYPTYQAENSTAEYEPEHNNKVQHTETNSTADNKPAQ